ncbi:hypothetical protein ACLOJK_016025 [Asimina triloba]
MHLILREPGTRMHLILREPGSPLPLLTARAHNEKESQVLLQSSRKRHPMLRVWTKLGQAKAVGKESNHKAGAILKSIVSRVHQSDWDHLKQ